MIQLKGYSDADWGSDLDSCRSISEYMFTINTGVVSWSSKWQPTVMLSTAKAKYMALTHTMKEAIWLCTLLHKLNFKQDTTIIFEDNQLCIALVKNPVHHTCMKHINI